MKGLSVIYLLSIINFGASSKRLHEKKVLFVVFNKKKSSYFFFI